MITRRQRRWLFGAALAWAFLPLLTFLAWMLPMSVDWGGTRFEDYLFYFMIAPFPNALILAVDDALAFIPRVPRTYPIIVDVLVVLPLALLTIWGLKVLLERFNKWLVLGGYVVVSTVSFYVSTRYLFF